MFTNKHKSRLFAAVSIFSLLIFRISTFSYTVHMSVELPSAQFVDFDFILVVTGLYSVIGIFNIGNGTSVEISERQNSFLENESSIFIIIILCMIVTTPLMVVLTQNRAFTLNITILVFLLGYLQAIYVYTLNVNRFLFRHGRIITVHLIMSIILLIGMFKSSSLDQTLLTFNLCYLVVLILELWNFKNKKISFYKSRETAQKILTLSLSTMAMSMSPVLILYLDRAWLLHIIPHSMQNIYIVDIRFAIMFGSIFSLLTTFMMPFYFQKGEHAFTRYRSRFLLLLSMLWMSGMTFIYIISQYTIFLSDVQLGVNYFIFGLSLFLIYVASLYSSMLLSRDHSYLIVTYLGTILVFCVAYQVYIRFTDILHPSICHLIVAVYILFMHYNHHRVVNRK